MREAGASDAVDAILHTFLRQAPDRLATLAAAVTSGQPDDIAQAAHAFRGAVATIGAHELAGLLERIESAARRGDVAQVREVFEPTRGETGLVLEYIRRSRDPAGVDGGRRG
jgi:HPt (histidine-containing phosphotransfer) domain-containing protein